MYKRGINKLPTPTDGLSKIKETGNSKKMRKTKMVFTNKYFLANSKGIISDKLSHKGSFTNVAEEVNMMKEAPYLKVVKLSEMEDRS